MKYFIALIPVILTGCLTSQEKFRIIVNETAKVNQEISYQADPIGEDIWQSPSETEKLKHGDCEDIALLLYDRLNKRHIKTKLTIGKIFITDTDGHLWLTYDSDLRWIVDPTIGLVLPPRNGIYIEYPQMDYYIKEKMR